MPDISDVTMCTLTYVETRACVRSCLTQNRHWSEFHSGRVINVKRFALRFKLFPTTRTHLRYNVIRRVTFEYGEKLREESNGSARAYVRRANLLASKRLSIHRGKKTGNIESRFNLNVAKTRRSFWQSCVPRFCAPNCY